jgi:hypothetical protein
MMEERDKEKKLLIQLERKEGIGEERGEKEEEEEIMEGESEQEVGDADLAVLELEVRLVL